MGLDDLFLTAALLLILRLIPNRNGRVYGLTACAVFFIFWLQPPLPIRGMDFWFPAASLTLSFCVFAAVRGKTEGKRRENLLVCLGAYAFVLLLSLSRELSYDGVLTASRPPLFGPVLGFVCVGFLLSALSASRQNFSRTALIVLLLVFLVIFKCAPITLRSSVFLRTLNGQSAETASGSDLRWLGFSYLTFRFLSVLIDSRKGRTFDFTAAEFLVYTCFPPTLSTGPIDRAERFIKDLRKAPCMPLAEDLRAALLRIAQGLFKKYLLADQLGVFALSASNGGQFLQRGWAWAALIAYGLQLYFDFAGCTDLALGLGRILGLRLPENFDHPYLKPDLTKFWSSWHMTLTQWIRSYVFNPLTRLLRSNKERPLPKPLIILIGQLSTMLLIGLWHGISVNFVIWGLWHGIGLFVHQQYNEKSGARIRTIQKNHPKVIQGYNVCSTLISDFYVLLGWVWFVLPDFSQALTFFGLLF